MAREAELRLLDSRQKREAYLLKAQRSNDLIDVNAVQVRPRSIIMHTTDAQTILVSSL